MNVWRSAARWVAAAVLLGLAPVPAIAGRLILADRGATPVTATVVAVGVAGTLLCLVGSVTAARLAHRPVRQRQPARHTIGRRTGRQR